mmetsp:Transcript_9856/g.30734  ORF Transcript_9856/g.30734 Transcript_9856/m.30734 type:complete len:277 (+) Transcript_9856:967-1797(+)
MWRPRAAPAAALQADARAAGAAPAPPSGEAHARVWETERWRKLRARAAPAAAPPAGTRPAAAPPAAQPRRLGRSRGPWRRRRRRWPWRPALPARQGSAVWRHFSWQSGGWSRVWLRRCSSGGCARLLPACGSQPSPWTSGAVLSTSLRRRLRMRSTRARLPRSWRRSLGGPLRRCCSTRRLKAGRSCASSPRSSAVAGSRTPRSQRSARRRRRGRGRVRRRSVRRPRRRRPETPATDMSRSLPHPAELLPWRPGARSPWRSPCRGPGSLAAGARPC